MDSKKKFGISISVKFAFYFALFGMVLTSVFYVVFQLLVLPQIEENIKSRLEDFAIVASNLVNKDDHQRILDMGLSSDSKEYRDIKSTLQSIAKSSDQIDSIYTLVPTKNPDVFNFVVDSSVPIDKNGNGVIDEDEVPAEINEPYDASNFPDLKAGLLRVSVDQRATTDKWGTFISAYAPIKLASGQTIGLVGVDLRYDKFLADINDFKSRAYLIFGLLIVLCMLLGFLMGKGLVWRLRGIVQKIREMSAEDSTNYIDVQGSDEIAELFTIINEMVRGLRAGKTDLKAEVETQTEALTEKLSDLEKLNKLMIGRELTMMELKKKIKNQNG